MPSFRWFFLLLCIKLFPLNSIFNRCFPTYPSDSQIKLQYISNTDTRYIQDQWSAVWSVPTTPIPAKSEPLVLPEVVRSRPESFGVIGSRLESVGVAVGQRQSVICVCGQTFNLVECYFSYFMLSLSQQVSEIEMKRLTIKTLERPPPDSRHIRMTPDTFR